VKSRFMRVCVERRKCATCRCGASGVKIIQYVDGDEGEVSLVVLSSRGGSKITDRALQVLDDEDNG